MPSAEQSGSTGQDIGARSKRQLFFHVGAHRTATTSTQKFLKANGGALLQQGVLYPYRVSRHLKVMNQLFSGKLDPADLAADLTTRADNRPKPVHTIVMSDEDIIMRRDLTPLARLREWFDVTILYTLRRQDLWLESWYFQNVKWQWDRSLAHLTFDQFMAQRDRFHWIHYDDCVRGLEGLFGSENIRLGVFEKAQMPKGPVIELAERIGLTDLDSFTEPPHINSSMSAEVVELARRLPLDQLEPPERHMLRRALEALDREVLGNTGKQSERLLDRRARERVLKDYAAGNRAVAERYFGREALFLEPLPDRGASLAKLEIPGDSATLIDRLVAPLLLQMIADRRSETGS